MPEHRMPLSTTALSRLQAERNRQTRGLRHSFASHRDRVMELIQSAGRLFPGPGSPSITVLGAGNCLDLNLKALADQFDVVRLVDIDRIAVEYGVEAQPGISSSVRIIAPMDLAAPLASLVANDVATAAVCEFVCLQLAQTLPVPPTEPGLAECCRNVQIHPPWRWQMGPRSYAVYAVDFRAAPLPRSEMTIRDAVPP